MQLKQALADVIAFADVDPPRWAVDPVRTMGQKRSAPVQAPRAS